MHSTCSSWLVVQGLASSLAISTDTSLCGAPLLAMQLGSGNLICKRAGGSSTCSTCGGNKFTCIVRLLSSLAVINGGW